MRRVTHYWQNTVQDSSITNWSDNDFNASLYYSYRTTQYTAKTFPSSLHYHDYYELIIFESGEINYICESVIYQPKPGDVLLIPPGKFHMSAIRAEKTLYKRHVFYLYPDALETYHAGALTAFLENCQGEFLRFSLNEAAQKELFALLQRFCLALENKSSEAYRALSVGLLIQIFFLLNGGQWQKDKHDISLPPNIVQIKEYIDENFRQIGNVNEVAKHFYYSREYVSRLFRKYFNTTILQYVTARRIAYSKKLMGQGCSIHEACYGSGFDHMSTFIRAFRSVEHMTPSEYRKEAEKTR